MLCATSLESRPPFCLSTYLLYRSLSRGSLSREEAGYRAAAAGGEKGLGGGMYGCDWKVTADGIGCGGGGGGKGEKSCSPLLV